jgi:hypothetical protein
MAEIIASFESGNDLDPKNPFDVDGAFDEEWTKLRDAFLSGCAVPDTAKWLIDVEAIKDESLQAYQDYLMHALQYSVAGFLQGLALGYEYAKREREAHAV